MLEQKVLGVVDNMAYLDATCPDCGSTHRVDVFGSGGGESVARTLTERLGYEIPLLAEIPMDPAMSGAGDEGVPLVATDPQRPAAAVLAGLAEMLAARRISLLGKSLGLTPVG